VFDEVAETVSQGDRCSCDVPRISSRIECDPDGLCRWFTGDLVGCLQSADIAYPNQHAHTRATDADQHTHAHTPATDGNQYTHQHAHTRATDADQTPTNTPTRVPPTPTNTLTPTRLPPTATNTPTNTPTRVPPTPTNTPTPIAAPTGPARARLNISSVSCVGCRGGSGRHIKVHFVVVNGYRRVNDYGSVSYTIRLPDGSTVSRTASMRKHTGNAVHYVDRFSGGNGAYKLVSAIVTVDGVHYDLANPGSVYDIRCRRCNARPRCR